MDDLILQRNIIMMTVSCLNGGISFLIKSRSKVLYTVYFNHVKYLQKAYNLEMGRLYLDDACRP